MIDQENGLPVGWVICRIGELISLKNGYAYKSSDYSDEGVPLIRISDIHNNQVSLERAVRIPESKVNFKFTIETGDLLIAMSGATTGKTGVYQGTKLCLQNQRVGNFKLFNEQILIKKYRNHYIASLYKAIEEKAYGGAQPNISAKDIEAFLITLPPLPEQHRIVAEIEKQLSRLDEAVAGLKRIQANLKRYRASVLKSAVEGKLTAEWRKQHPDIESAEQLLQRILKERRAHWEQAELEKILAAGKPSKDELWKQKYKEPVKPDVSGLTALPEGWVWATPEQLTSINKYALAIGPFGSNLKVSDYCQEGVPLVFVKNIRSKSFDGENTKYVSENKAYELTPHKVNPGDILITKMGEPPGDSCLYPLNCPPAIITADCIKWKLASILDNVFFFIYAINSQPLKLQIQKITKGVAQQKISLGRFKSLAIPLPSLQEQAQIVSEVERRLSIVDEVEQQININLKRAERLRQSILKKAFSGRLVPQDPDDEPADVLLEKIKQAQRA